MEKGKIVQVLGPVVDVQFDSDRLPGIKEALTVDNHGKTQVMEVSQHMGNNVVRCIILSSSDGLTKDMEVIATGDNIKVPVGKSTLGRMFNVLGQNIDNEEQVKGEDQWSIHREPPKFEDQTPAVEILETGIKVIDLLAFINLFLLLFLLLCAENITFRNHHELQKRIFKALQHSAVTGHNLPRLQLTHRIFAVKCTDFLFPQILRKSFCPGTGT